jgi:hypothetical protein
MADREGRAPCSVGSLPTATLGVGNAVAIDIGAGIGSPAAPFSPFSVIGSPAAPFGPFSVIGSPAAPFSPFSVGGGGRAGGGASRLDTGGAARVGGVAGIVRVGR